MKKILILFLTLICSTSLFSQEKRDYKLIDDNLIEVKVYRDGNLTQKGKMVNVGDKWVNDGIWCQYDKNGDVDLRVKYSKGIRLWITKHYDDYVVTLDKKRGQ